MQLSAELVHQRQQKQGLNVQLALLQKLLSEREGSVKQLSEQLFTREKEVILAKHQRNKLKKTINALEEQFEKFAKH